jgi:hypothetical protein
MIGTIAFSYRLLHKIRYLERIRAFSASKAGDVFLLGIEWTDLNHTFAGTINDYREERVTYDAAGETVQ